MDWIRSLRQAFDILTFRRSTIQAVAADPSAFLTGLSFVLLFSFVGGLGRGLLQSAFGAMSAVAGSFIVSGLLFLIARLFGGRGRYLGLWQTMAYTSVVWVLTLILSLPYLYLPALIHWTFWLVTVLNIVFSVYMFILNVFILETVMELGRYRAVAVGLIALLAVPLALMLVSSALAGDPKLALYLKPYLVWIF